MVNEKLLKTCYCEFSSYTNKKQSIGMYSLDFLQKEEDLGIMRKLNLTKKRLIIFKTINQ